ncbi:Outer membrane receptor proteins, mostly Fe transport [Pustulibacterium marinum]|uniref:Outer membrane receptor proteins, mostly Fe transport n=1 Tax=Pustulibacterium marinum TaxID=1224947 RepID=A0A1I7HFE7_9FLAO|nr:TonB-dependent receptor [Pustulibacterium marinum]SFU59279.1 Outer membrane receptor proteins, mostly Fe transport [Pustulibacterium marinum]
MKQLVCVIALLCTAISFSQTKVTGTIVDSDNEPIPSANVVLEGTSEGVVADFDGNFIFETEKNPPFNLVFSSIGFTAQVVEISTNNQKVTVSLEEEHTQLDEIVLSASRTPERVFESPVSVERMGIQQIKATPSASFYDGLENMKGVDLNTNSLTFKSVNTRGFATFANTRFVQLVDGMDNASPALNFVLGNLLGMNELDVASVELLPGASSALYGANAFNGILFMRSKSPFEHEGISAYVKGGVTSQKAAGTNEYYDLGLRLAKKFSDKFAVKGSVSYLSGTDWYATNYTDVNNPSYDRSNPAFNGLNIYGDEVATTLNFDELAGLPTGTIGSDVVSRTGYNEVDLMNYNAQSFKGDVAVHYKPFADDFEIIGVYKIGSGNTIYQGSNRYSLNDFLMQQFKLEVRNDNFFVRGYMTTENAGDSYDTRFAAINVNRYWKSDQNWFEQYAQTYIGARLGMGTGNPLDYQTAHNLARQAADQGRLLPGTEAYNTAFNQVINDPNLATGAKFQDQTKMHHVDANYNFSHLTEKFAEIQIGGSFREYNLNSNGTIFTDYDGPISYSEFGAYTQIQKKLADERLKITASGRFDKSQLFDGFFSPRLSLGYTIGESRNHNIRASMQTGFRNPTTQDLYIGLDAGAAILVGSSPDNLDRYNVTRTLSTSGQSTTGQTEATVYGRDAYENAFSLRSVNQGMPTAADVELVKPEQVTAVELGYRGKIKDIVLDVSGYFNRYKDFISTENVLVPLYGQVGDNSLSLLALQNGDYQVFQAYTNSAVNINSYGVNAGLETKIFKNYDLGVNYTYSGFDFDESEDPDFRPSFNTPKHKVKASFGNEKLFDNVGFNVSWRWSDAYFWQASFADGNVPAYHVVDAQVNYGVDFLNSTFKLGATNIGGHEYFQAIGTGYIGSMYYLSWTIQP